MFMEMANRRRRRGGGSVSPPAPTVEDILAGTAGMALDFSDLTRMWTTSAKATLVASENDFIGAIRSKWGAAEQDFGQVNTGDRPLWNGSIAGNFSGSDHLIGEGGALAILRNKPAGFASGRIIFDSLAGTPPVFMIGTSTVGQARFFLRVDPAGSLTAVVRATDGGTSTTGVSATGLITTGVAYVITMTCDYAGSGGVKVYIDGVEVISVALAVTPGNTSDTDSGRFWIGRNLTVTSQYLDGRISRMVFADKLMTAGEQAAIEAWVGEGVLS